jgi:hypothetical protein
MSVILPAKRHYRMCHRSVIGLSSLVAVRGRLRYCWLMDIFKLLDKTRRDYIELGAVSGTVWFDVRMMPAGRDPVEVYMRFTPKQAKKLRRAIKAAEQEARRG